MKIQLNFYDILFFQFEFNLIYKIIKLIMLTKKKLSFNYFFEIFQEI